MLKGSLFEGFKHGYSHRLFTCPSKIILRKEIEKLISREYETKDIAQQPAWYRVPEAALLFVLIRTSME